MAEKQKGFHHRGEGEKLFWVIFLTGIVVSTAMFKILLKTE
jgi:hypothetical protein